MLQKCAYYFTGAGLVEKSGLSCITRGSGIPVREPVPSHVVCISYLRVAEPCKPAKCEVRARWEDISTVEMLVGAVEGDRVSVVRL